MKIPMRTRQDKTGTRQDRTSKTRRVKTYKTSTVQGLQIQTEELIAVAYREVTGRVSTTLTYDPRPGHPRQLK